MAVPFLLDFGEYLHKKEPPPEGIRQRPKRVGYLESFHLYGSKLVRKSK